MCSLNSKVGVEVGVLGKDLVKLIFLKGELRFLKHIASNKLNLSILPVR